MKKVAFFYLHSYTARMLLVKNGRTRSIRTEAEIQELLSKDLESLSKDEQQAFLIMLTQLEETGTSELIDTIEDMEYETKPVDIETFLSDPYYLGNTSLYPVLRQDMIELVNGKYHEAIMTGAIGFGKTHFAGIGICRLIYELSCLRNPQKSFGIGNDFISVACFGPNERLAIEVTFNAIVSKMEQSEYFKKKFPFKKTKKEIIFPKKIQIASRATTDTAALGLHIVGAIQDEADFLSNRKGVISDGTNRAKALYDQIMRRMKSRFMRNGNLPGIYFIVSSKKTTEDFTAKRLKEAVNDPTIFVRDYSQWDVKGDYSKSKFFYVLAGNEKIASKILKPDEEIKNIESRPEGTVLVRVPHEFRNDFEADIEGALRDLAGVATVSVHPFIQRREKIQEALDLSRKHPCTEITYDPSNPPKIMWDKITCMQQDFTGLYQESRERPLVDPTAVRYAHIDIGLTKDGLGLCIGHIAGHKDVVRRSGDGAEYIETAPVYYIDFCLRVVPPVGGEILLEDVRHLIYDFTAHGYNISHVSFDRHQSADSMQQFQTRGYTTSLVSTVTSMAPYQNVKSALYENRVIMYEYEPLLKELRELEEKTVRGKREVDHPSDGSKDIADALAGVMYSLSNAGNAATYGAPMGFMIGDMSPSMQLASMFQTPALRFQSSSGNNTNYVLPIMFGSSDSDD